MTQQLPPLQTRSELNQKLEGIQQVLRATMYLALIIYGFATNWFFAILLFVPAWLVYAFVYSRIDDYYEEKFKQAIQERKRNLTNK